MCHTFPSSCNFSSFSGKVSPLVLLFRFVVWKNLPRCSHFSFHLGNIPIGHTSLSSCLDKFPLGHTVPTTSLVRSSHMSHFPSSWLENCPHKSHLSFHWSTKISPQATFFLFLVWKNFPSGPNSHSHMSHFSFH